jgi:hypothetical protein
VIKLSGPCQINAVSVGEISIDLFAPSPVLNVKFAYINTTTGYRVGSGQRSNWSEETLKSLHALVESMERDIAQAVGDVDTTTPSATRLESATTDDVPSL